MRIALITTGYIVCLTIACNASPLAGALLAAPGIYVGLKFLDRITGTQS